MKCGSCGAEFSSGKFCVHCGAPLVDDAPAEAAAVESQPVASAADEGTAVEAAAAPAPANDVPPASEAASEQGAAGNQEGAYQAAPVYGAPAQDIPVTPGNTSEGILKQAWQDFRQDPAFVTKSLLLGVISLVPILNFVSAGYASRWGRRAAFRTGDKLPSSVFEDKSFETGFYIFVVMLVWGIVLGLVGLIPFIGWVVDFMAAPFALLAAMYVAMADDLGAGFRISDLWEKGKRNYGGLLLVTYIPGLIAGVVGSVLVGLIMVFAGVDIYAGTGGFLIAFLLLVAYFMCVVLVVGALLVSYRAMGYWVGRMAPEWVKESVSKGVHPQ